MKSAAQLPSFLPGRAGSPAATGFVALGLVLLTLVAFWPATRNGFVFDDVKYVVDNTALHGGLTARSVGWAFGGFHASNWHPVTWLSHLLDAELYGLDPFGHHLTSILLHAANAALLFLLLQSLTGLRWRSAAVAALFAVHPLRVESVAWVAERKDVLSAFFGVLTLVFYARFVRAPARAAYLLSLAFFLLGLMSKPMLVTLPLLLLLVDFWPLGRLEFTRVSPRALLRSPPVREKAPFLALAALFSLITLAAQSHGGAVQTLEEFPLWIRAGNAVLSAGAYAGKVLWPQRLAVFYPHPGFDLPLWKVAAAAAAHLCLLAAAWRYRRRIPYLLAGLLWYLVSLLPVIGIVQVGDQAMADRYTYIPTIGLLLIVVWGSSDISAGRRRGGMALALAAALALGLLVARTRAQLRSWSDNVTLFEHALDLFPENHLALYNLGLEYERLGLGGKAVAAYSEAVRIKPGADYAHNNLGVALSLEGRNREAVGHFQEALRLNPRHRHASFNLGKALLALGEHAEAIGHLRDAVRADPRSPEASNELGIALFMEGRREEALRQFERALEIDPSMEEAHYNVGIALAALGRPAEAAEHYRAVLRIDPGHRGARERLGELEGGRNGP